MKKILIISDNKPGHLNQSIAFCKLKNINFDILELDTSRKIYKTLSYVLDFFSFYINLFQLKPKNHDYLAVVSTGSFTYYANKYISKKLNIKSIAIMLPKGFRYKDFDYIIAQEHDNPKPFSNIIIIPLNLSINNPFGYIKKSTIKSVGIILGGNNRIFSMNRNDIKDSLDEIYSNYPNHLKYITTSRRTPAEIDTLLKEYKFDYEIIYSKNNKINPISDFINVCDELYISIDSTSMLSEARAGSEANIHIIDLTSSNENTKYHRLALNIKKLDAKFNYSEYLDKVQF